MQEITGAKPVRDTNFIAPKAFLAMLSLGKRIIALTERGGGQSRIDDALTRHDAADRYGRLSGRRFLDQEADHPPK